MLKNGYLCLDSFLRYYTNGACGVTVAVIYGLFIASCITVHISYMTIQSKIGDDLVGSPIYNAFENPIQIYAGIIFNISTSAPNAVDILFDRLSARTGDSKVENFGLDEMERCLLVILNVITGSIVLKNAGHPHVAHIYSCVHALQYVGAYGIVLGLCHKLVPKHFPAEIVILSQFLFAGCSVGAMFSFGYPVDYWVNILTFVLVAFFFASLLFPLYRWLKEVRSRLISSNVKGNNKRNVHTWSCIPIEEKCALWYMLTLFSTILIIPGIAAFTKLCAWYYFSEPYILIFIYTYSLFGIVVSCVPGRLVRASISLERQRSIDTKRTLIRYFSHEIRTPITVINSGIEFIREDIRDCPKDVKEIIDDGIMDIRNACSGALTVLDDLLHFEAIDDGSFHVHLKMMPCQVLKSLGKSCRIMAASKDIKLHNNIDLKVDPMPDKPEDMVHVLIDNVRLEQVLRNLIVNAIKFTPPGKTVSITQKLEMFPPSIIPDDDYNPSTPSPLDGSSHKLSPLVSPLEFITQQRRLDANSKDKGSSSLHYHSKGHNNQYRLKLFSQSHQTTKSFHHSATNETYNQFSSVEEGSQYFNKPFTFPGFTSTTQKEPTPPPIEYEGDVYVPCGMIRIQVADEGVGIEKEKFRNLFDAFAQFNPNDLQGGGGSGLGLWISKEILSQHGCTIHFESKGQNQGTQFFFNLVAYKMKTRIKSNTDTRQMTTLETHTPFTNMEKNMTVSSPFVMAGTLSDKKSNSVPSSSALSTMELSCQSTGAGCIQIAREGELIHSDVSHVDNNNNVTLSMPLQRRVLSPPPLSSPPPSTSSSSSPSSSSSSSSSFLSASSQSSSIIRILVVDDSSLIRKVIRKSLTKCISQINNELNKDVFYEFYEEEDGKPVPERVQSMQDQGTPITIIFMDNIMNHMHGPQAAKILRSQGFNREIIGITGQVADNEVADFVRQGATLVLSKPMKSIDLKDILFPIVKAA